MRRTAAIVLTAGLLLAAPAASAEGPTYDRAATKACPVGVVGFDAQRHVRTYLIKDGQVTRDQLSANALGFDVTAWGYYDQAGKGSRRTLRLNAVTADGTPHNVAVKQSKKKLAFKKSPRYDGKLKPRLFADGGLFYAYVVKGGTLKRYGLYRYPDGSRRFDAPVRVVGGARDWTSLQAGAYKTRNGATTEYLYGTTAQGGLFRVAVPVKNPGRAKVTKLASTGYAGVTEISWGRCGKDLALDVLVTISPTTNSATWTTIKRPRVDRPKAKLRGAVTGGPDWNFAAAY